MSKRIHPTDLAFFSTLAAAGSLSVAARELGISTPAVSKHLAQMEARVGSPLVNRTTRRMSLTPEGEVYLEHARRILGDLDAMEQAIGAATEAPRGLLRVNATLGFGRRHLAPLISRFVKRYDGVEVRLELSVDPHSLVHDGFDVCIRFGASPETRVVERKLAANRRLLCASPAYLARFGVPKVPADLARHQCITIRQGSAAYGVWRLSGRGRADQPQSVRVRGPLATNDGEIAVTWALEGHGIVMRAEWDVERHLKSGRLVQVLPQFDTPEADIYAVYPERHRSTPRVRVFVEFLEAAFAAESAARH